MKEKLQKGGGGGTAGLEAQIEELRDQLSGAAEREAKAVGVAVSDLQKELQELQEASSVESRRAREDMAAVRSRARALAEEKEEELIRLRHTVKVLDQQVRASGGSSGGVTPASSHASLGKLLDAAAAPSPADSEKPVAIGLMGGDEGGPSTRPPASPSGKDMLSPTSAIGHAARVQAGRDAETMALRQKVASLELEVDTTSSELRQALRDAAELRRSQSRTEAGEAAGFLKDVLFKYLVASEEQQTTIFPLLANVVQFTKGELEHIKRVKEVEKSTTTATGILSSFFLAPATDEQDTSFADPAAVTQLPPGVGPQPSAEALPPGGGFSAWMTPASQGASTVSATPLKTPYSEKPNRHLHPEDDPVELRKKVGRMKKLLQAANAQIEKLSNEKSAALDDTHVSAQLKAEYARAEDVEVDNAAREEAARLLAAIS